MDSSVPPPAPLDGEKLRELLEKATPGPWEVTPADAGKATYENHLSPLCVCNGGATVARLTQSGHHRAKPAQLADARLIVFLRNNAEALLAPSSPAAAPETRALETGAIPRDQWRWSGVAGHFICGYKCRFHMRTEIGDILVSTVGEYYSGGPRDDSYVLESIGGSFRGEARTFYETYVFVLGEDRCARADCDCGDREPKEWSEIAGRRWTLRGQAQRGHYEFCERAARGEFAAAALQAAAGRPA